MPGDWNPVGHIIQLHVLSKSGKRHHSAFARGWHFAKVSPAFLINHLIKQSHIFQLRSKTVLAAVGGIDT